MPSGSSSAVPKRSKSQQDSKGDTVLRFWLDEQKVQHVELEGEEVSITDATSGQRKRLADLLKVLQKWAGEEKPSSLSRLAPLRQGLLLSQQQLNLRWL